MIHLIPSKSFYEAFSNKKIRYWRYESFGSSRVMFWVHLQRRLDLRRRYIHDLINFEQVNLRGIFQQKFVPVETKLLVRLESIFDSIFSADCN
jgi:hypothetical protein